MADNSKQCETFHRSLLIDTRVVFATVNTQCDTNRIEVALEEDRLASCVLDEKQLHTWMESRCFTARQLRCRLILDKHRHLWPLVSAHRPSGCVSRGQTPPCAAGLLSRPEATC